MKNIKFNNLKSLLTGFALVILLILSGCGSDGDTGSTGGTGAAGATGPAGPVGPTPPSEITETMSSAITGATITDGNLTVTFTLADDSGFAFVGLPNDRIRFTAVQLFPANAQGDGESTNWQSYVNRIEAAPTDPEKGPGTVDAVQATSERDGTFTDNSDGSYSYTYLVNLLDVTDPVAVTHNPEYTHRVAFQISGGGFPTINETYDWQPSTGLTTGITSREMVVEGTCNGCHGELALHGGGRVDTAYCVTCHNPGTVDANSGNNLDFKVMIHKIHRGANLPSVLDGGEYAIWGFRDSKHDYSTTHLPQDIRNCANCHDESIAETPDAVNWMDAPTIEACGSCHDEVDFALGIDGGHPGGVFTDNSECALCHAQDRFLSTTLQHVGVMEQVAATKLEATAVAEAIRIDQGTGDVEVDVRLAIQGVPVVALRDIADVDTDEGAVLGKYKYGTDNGSLAINWDNGEGYQLNHQEVDFNDCVADGAGLFTCSAAGLLAGITDADVVTTTTVDLFLCLNERDGSIVRCDEPETSINRVAQVDVTPEFVFFNGDDTITTDSYDKFGADIESCEACHADSKYHHGSTELGQCKTCHNATRASSRGRPGDLKHHVHRFHAGLDDDILIPVEAGDADHFPSSVANCNACHTEDQIDLPLQVNHRASAANRDAPVFISPTAVVCAACHVDAALGYIDPTQPGYMDEANGTIPRDDQAVVDHIIQNGGVFGAATFEEANKVESCAVCHAIGSEYGVDAVHKILEK